jgi:hypothetical protein
MWYVLWTKDIGFVPWDNPEVLKLALKSLHKVNLCKIHKKGELIIDIWSSFLSCKYETIEYIEKNLINLMVEFQSFAIKNKQ